MDFSTEFVALRDRLVRTQHKSFVSEQNVEVVGRVAALYSTFSIKSERRVLGLMPTGNAGHAHEYRMLFAEPRLDEDSLTDWWEYAREVERTLVKPDATHDFSIVSLVLVTQTADRAVQKKLRRLSAERQFAGGKQGWSSIHFAVVDLSEHKIYTNRLGGTLKNILQQIV